MYFHGRQKRRAPCFPPPCCAGSTHMQHHHLHLHVHAAAAAFPPPAGPLSPGRRVANPPCAAPCCRWHQAPLMPGAERLISHLSAHSVPLALATSTSRASLQRKLSTRAHVQEAFVQTCCGDEVRCVRCGLGACRAGSWRMLCRAALQAAAWLPDAHAMIQPAADACLHSSAGLGKPPLRLPTAPQQPAGRVGLPGHSQRWNFRPCPWSPAPTPPHPQSFYPYPNLSTYPPS